MLKLFKTTVLLQLAVKILTDAMDESNSLLLPRCHFDESEITLSGSMIPNNSVISTRRQTSSACSITEPFLEGGTIKD
jgi:hypothetical protein